MAQGANITTVRELENLVVGIKLPSSLVDGWLDVEPTAEGDFCWVNVVRTVGGIEVDNSVAIFLPDTTARILYLIRERIDEAVRDNLTATTPDNRNTTHHTTKDDNNGIDRNLACCGLRAVAVGEGAVNMNRNPARTTLEIPLADILAMGLSAVVQ